MTITRTERHDIHQSEQLFNVICDDGRSSNCSGDENEFEGSFHTVVQKIQEAGWKSIKIRDEWTHCCPACAEDKRAAAFKSFRGRYENG